MSDLVAVAYPDLATAREVGQTLMKLQAGHRSSWRTSRSPSGRTTARSSCARPSSPWPPVRPGGALWGGLIGLIFFMPLLGMAIGGATGAAAGAADRRRRR